MPGEGNTWLRISDTKDNRELSTKGMKHGLLKLLGRGVEGG